MTEQRREVETVERAAVMKDGVVYDVPRPLRHDAAIRKAHRALGLSEDPMEPLREDEQGFVTSTGRFVNRYEAARIAFRAGQTPALIRRTFTSEDLWLS